MRRFFTGEAPNAEYIARESQLPADLTDPSGRLAGEKERAVQVAAPGEPPVLYDVRCVFDSRPVNAYDGNFSQIVGEVGTTITARFLVPSGYRAIPREWRVNFDTPPVALITDLQAFVQANDADLPNNNFYVGAGTSVPFKTFFLVEENAAFGLRITDVNGVIVGNTIIEVWCNLLPVTGVALPFEATNRKL